MSQSSFESHEGREQVLPTSAGTDDRHGICGCECVWEFLNNKEVERKYKLTWEDGLYIDTVTLSRDGKKLAGKNQKGEKVSAERVAP